MEARCELVVEPALIRLWCVVVQRLVGFPYRRAELVRRIVCQVDERWVTHWGRVGLKTAANCRRRPSCLRIVTLAAAILVTTNYTAAGRIGDLDWTAGRFGLPWPKVVVERFAHDGRWWSFRNQRRSAWTVWDVQMRLMSHASSVGANDLVEWSGRSEKRKQEKDLDWKDCWNSIGIGLHWMSAVSLRLIPKEIAWLSNLFTYDDNRAMLLKRSW